MTIRLQRLFAAVIMGLGLGLWIRHDYAHWTALGRDAFLAYEASRFDRYVSKPHAIGMMIGAIILVLIFIGVYELCVAFFEKLTAKKKASV